MWWLITLLLITPAFATPVEITGGAVTLYADRDFRIHVTGDNFTADGFIQNGDLEPFPGRERDPLVFWGLEWMTVTWEDRTFQASETSEWVFVHDGLCATPTCSTGLPPEPWTLSTPFTMSGTLIDAAGAGSVDVVGQGTIVAESCTDDWDVNCVNLGHRFAYVFTPPAAGGVTVPEPGTLALLGLGLGWMAWRRPRPV